MGRGNPRIDWLFLRSGGLAGAPPQADTLPAMKTASSWRRSWIQFLAAAATLSLTAAAGAQGEGRFPFQRQDRDEAINRLVGGYRSGDRILRIAEVRSRGFQRPLYVEMVEQGQEDKPVRQQLWVFYPQEQTGLHMRAFRFPERTFQKGERSLADLAVGLWAAPEDFPEIRPSQYRPISDLQVEVDKDRVALRSDALSVVLTDQTLEWSDAEFDEQAQSPLQLTRSQEQLQDAAHREPGLLMIDLRVGEGPAAAPGDSAMIEYTGWTADGVMFDSTELPGRRDVITKLPWKTIEGLRDGVHGMRALPRIEPGKGGLRRLLISPSLGFGNVAGRPDLLPPNASLIYNVHLRTLRDNTPQGEGELEKENDKQGAP